MATIEICPFCGKELKVGFFSGEGEYISIGPKLASVYLCKDCCEQHKPNLKRIKKRFNIKCDNYRKARNIKKLSVKELIDLYNIYIEQEAVQSEKSLNKVLDSSLNYFLLGEDGFFSVREFGKGFLNEDIGVRDMLKSADKSINTECLAFDKDDNLLVPFRTWRNTTTEKAADELTELFEFNIPQRWSIALLYQAILNEEPHVSEIAHITTLAGYIHVLLTGRRELGVGEASGMFPTVDNH